MSAYERFERDVPEEKRDDVLTMMTEAAHGATVKGVHILDTDRMDAINVRANGSIDIDGEEHSFIIESGNWNGTVLESWDDDKEFEPLPRTQWALAPHPMTVMVAIENGNPGFLLMKWDNMLKRTEVSEIPGKYSYDRMVQPGLKVERYWKEKAEKFGFVLTSKESADETRKSLQQKGAQ